jgi:polyphenol oxidase
MPVLTNWLQPDWPAPANVQAFVTTRVGGVSPAPWDSLNLGTHVGDNLARVRHNRALLRAALPEVRRFQWLNQVHGTRLVDVAPGASYLRRRTADAAAVYAPGDAAIVMTADCLPVFFCATNGSAAAVAHAGWRGLLAGILENTVAGLARSGTLQPSQLLVWMGPAIAGCHFEVGDEVRQAFIDDGQRRGIDPRLLVSAFTASSQANKWMMDIYQVARLRLQAIGLTAVYGGDFCTVCDHQRFYSYRRDGVTGRMANLIYLKNH